MTDYIDSDRISGGENQSDETQIVENPDDFGTGGARSGGGTGTTQTDSTPEPPRSGPPDDPPPPLGPVELVPDTDTLRVPVRVEVVRDTVIPVAPRIRDSLRAFFKPLFDQYYDQKRVGKTLLNYREDEQFPVLNWKPKSDSDGVFDEVALKLRDPLPIEKDSGDRVHVSREIQNSVYDVIDFLDLDIDLIPQLRPATINISEIAPQTRVTATLEELIPEIAGGSAQISSGSTLIENVQFVDTFERIPTGDYVIGDLLDYGWGTMYGSVSPETDIPFSVIEDPDAPGGKALRMFASPSHVAWLEYTASADLFTTETDVLVQIRFSGAPSTFDFLGAGPLIRTTGGFYTVESENGSGTFISDGDIGLRGRRNSVSALGSWGTGSLGFVPSPDTWYWLRVQNERANQFDTSSVTHRVKVWEDGTPEPSTWVLEDTRPNASGEDPADFDWDYDGTSADPLVSGGVGFAWILNNNVSGSSHDIGYFAASSDLNNPVPAGSTGETVTVSSNYSNFVTNQILEKYYDINNLTAAPINVDYSDFENFVTFGSAQSRLDVFKAKLESIQELVLRAPVFVDQLRISGSANLSGSYQTVFGTLEIDAQGSASLSSTSATYQAATNSLTSEDYVNTAIVLSRQLQELIRSFDDYEKTLWFGRNLPYSGSDPRHYDDNVYYLEDYTYPKILGIPLATTTQEGIDWYGDLSTLAEEYDERNQNALIKNVPFYLQDDDESVDFQTFVDMVGHHFDNVKIYIQNLENMYSRYPKIGEELSGNLTQYVLESFGVNIPSATSIESLIEYVTGPESGSVAYQDIANEYYKRYMHALPFLLKTKGTKQSINSLLNVFGINPNLLAIRETLSNRFTTSEPTKITSTEQDFALEFNSGSYLEVPLSASLRSPQTIQARLATLVDTDQTLLAFGDSFVLDAVQHPSASTNTYYANYGRIELLSSSVSLVTSSYFDLFDENYFHVQLQNDVSGVQLEIAKIENEEFTFTQSLVEPASMSAVWSDLPYTYIGAPLDSGSYSYTSMSLDEFRMWGEQIDRDIFLQWTENPGAYYGNSYTSSIQDLYVRLSFNIPNDVSSSGYVPNTSPYVSKSFALDLTNISGSGFRSGTSPLYQTSRLVRTVTEITYGGGGRAYTTDMIKISDAAPEFTQLSSNYTVVPQRKKFASGSVGDSTLDISISPMDAVDRDVIRSLGNINLGDFIGNPQDKNNYRYTALENLEKTFIRDLAPVIDYNGFIRYFDKFLKLFYQVLEDYIPARARLTKGIVIRSSVIDRNKINNRTNIKSSGETSRRNGVEYLPEDVVRSFDITLPVTESWDTEVQATFGNSVDTSINLPDYSGTVNDMYVPAGDVFGGYDQDGFTDLYFDLNRPTPEPVPVPLYDPTSDDQTQIGGSTTTITPVDNFTGQPTDAASHTYFTSLFGLYYIDAKRLIPVTESFMPQQPTVTTWSAGTRYQRGDVVLQPSGSLDENGTPYSQNGKYFVFIDQGFPGDPTVQSTIIPQLDTQLWSPLKYTPQIYQKLARYSFVNNDTGSLTLQKTVTNAYDSVPNGYERQHFRFYRENSLGARRRTYLGTLNTTDTTVDGRPPFEVFNLNVNTIQVGAPEQCD